MAGLDPFSSVSFIRLLIVYGNVGHILILGVGEKLGISRHCDWEGYLAVAGLNLLAQKSDRICPGSV